MLLQAIIHVLHCCKTYAVFFFSFFNSSFIICTVPHLQLYACLKHQQDNNYSESFMSNSLIFQNWFFIKHSKVRISEEKKNRQRLISPLKITFSFIRRTCRDSWFWFSLRWWKQLSRFPWGTIHWGYWSFCELLNLKFKINHIKKSTMFTLSSISN